MADPTSHQPMPPEMSATHLEVRALPLWAIVAWSARCARRVQPLLLSAWSERPASDFEPVESAICFAESVARNPSRLASHVDRTKEISFPAWTGFAKEDTRIACGFAAVQSARNAAEAAIAARTHITTGNIRADDESMNRVVMPATGGAWQAHVAIANAFSDVLADWSAMRLDRELLLSLAKENRWSDESPVDVALLGPLWPPGMEPNWAKQPPNDADIAGLEVTYTVPDGVSDEDAIKLINQHLAAMSDLHRSLGGSGLRVIPPTDVQEPARAERLVGA